MYGALKLIDKNKFFKIDALKNEVNLMKKIENDNSVKIYDQYNSKEEYVIVIELCDCNLKERLDETSNGLKVIEIKNILIQLNNTFRKMVDNKIIHRDIKLENILLKYDKNKKYIVKLCDYGVSKQLETLSKEKQSFAGTNLIMAPEVLKDEPYNNKCDLWSLGVIIYQLCFKEFPYDANSQYGIIMKIEQSKQENFKKTYNYNLDDLIRKLLIPNPDERITWDQYFNHPFLNK